MTLRNVVSRCLMETIWELKNNLLKCVIHLILLCSFIHSPINPMLIFSSLNLLFHPSMHASIHPSPIPSSFPLPIYPSLFPHLFITPSISCSPDKCWRPHGHACLEYFKYEVYKTVPVLWKLKIWVGDRINKIILYKDFKLVEKHSSNAWWPNQ